jgi:pimeloyl-ACP methyl ester carboxylesterase
VLRLVADDISDDGRESLTQRRQQIMLDPITLAAESLPSLPISTDRLEQRYTDEHSAFVGVDDARIHYREHGDPTNRTVLLVHGTYSSLQTWDDWVDELADEYHLVRLDLPGFGLTGPRERGEHTVGELVRLVGLFCDELGLDSVAFAGNSLGGGIGLRLAVERPDLLSGLILLDAGGGTLICRVIDSLTTPMFAQFGLSRTVVRLLINDAYAPGNSPSAATVRRYHDLVRRSGNRPATKECARTFRRAHPEECARRRPFPTPPSLLTSSPTICDEICAKNIDNPTLLQWGHEDRWLPPAFGRKIADLLTESRFLEYEGVGHVPMEESPHETATDAKQFLDTLV